MNYLTIEEVVDLHERLIAQSGGSFGILDRGKLESALAQPYMTFGGEELYPTLVDKASSLAFSLAGNHAFVDGNKRIAHAVMETFLAMNGHEVQDAVDEQELIFLQLAGHALTREQFTDWLRQHVIPYKKT